MNRPNLESVCILSMSFCVTLLCLCVPLMLDSTAPVIMDDCDMLCGMPFVAAACPKVRGLKWLLWPRMLFRLDDAPCREAGGMSKESTSSSSLLFSSKFLFF